MIKNLNCYCGSTILGYRFVLPNLMSQEYIGDTPVAKPIINNNRGVDYNCDKKLLKTIYRRRRKTQLQSRNVVVAVE